ncbi:hypothetical protein GYMLUDRAFT_63588 [Collybiopsis luxurians FD-317 M1]|uniref:NAD(P)-binding protein n=1 Tax=Collybiopsis luxurians FD-317 M1 TaxID=944289 RepID=A0A0D0CFH3_9AGAR|nr:hypothetical protein GYMLUDRAFT_63588 [Collybiopsis luxurians FD-317 M1]
MASPRVWLITGTSSGFGRRFVTAILRRGDRVIATARNLASIQKPDFFPKSDNLRTMQLDISVDEETIKKKAQEALSFWGRVDVLINNAGFPLKIFAEDATLADFQSQFQTNFYGPAALTTALLPQMRSRNEGTIVMIGSRSSWEPLESLSIYAASKAALRVYSETLAKENFSKYPGIRIIIAEPAGFRTESNILGYPQHAPSGSDTAYDVAMKKGQSFFDTFYGQQKGDPDKAVELMVDVVRGEGRAESRIGYGHLADSNAAGSLIYLPLGKEANTQLEAKCKKMLRVVKEWRDLTDNLDHEDANLAAWAKS